MDPDNRAQTRKRAGTKLFTVGVLLAFSLLFLLLINMLFNKYVAWVFSLFKFAAIGLIIVGAFLYLSSLTSK